MRVVNKLSSQSHLHSLIQQLHEAGITTYEAETTAIAHLHLLLWIREHQITHILQDTLPLQTLPQTESSLKELPLQTIPLSKFRHFSEIHTATLAECNAAIAETGTFIFSSLPPRALASLLWPPYLFIVLPKDRIIGTWAQWAHPPSYSQLSMTGLSTTYSISNTITRGHGPRHVHVLLIG